MDTVVPSPSKQGANVCHFMMLKLHNKFQILPISDC